MSYFHAREYQGRVNGIFNKEVLVVDGMSGPNTRKWIAKAMDEMEVQRKQDLFDRGVRGVVWHWTAGAKGLISLERKAYNFLHDVQGNTYDGNSTIAEQVMYDWRKGVGASHTKSMNTGWIGSSIDAMAGATGWPLSWGSNPITWEGIDAMLEHTFELSEEYNFPITKWTTLGHAEVQGTLGIKQRNKWDFMVLPGDDRVRGAVEVGDILRARLIEKFM